MLPENDLLKESGTDDAGHLLKVEKRQEVDGFEFAVDGERTADAVPANNAVLVEKTYCESDEKV